ncbi:transposase [Nocardia sp. NPDC006630]|uniref:transposase n=1 Tax=Nocardia sp. NPDC006630 TaxID=3157181 RepID=UPI0033BDEEFC
MPKRYSEEIRRKVLELITAGRTVARVSADLGIAEQTIYNWRRQELIATGQAPLTRAGLAELAAAQKRIRELEKELSRLRLPSDEQDAAATATAHTQILQSPLTTGTVLAS